MFLNKKAQSTLEYIIIITALIAVIFFSANSFIRPAIQNGIGTNAANAIQAAAAKF